VIGRSGFIKNHCSTAWACLSAHHAAGAQLIASSDVSISHVAPHKSIVASCESQLALRNQAKQTALMKYFAFDLTRLIFIFTLLLGSFPFAVSAQEKQVSDRVFMVPDPKSTSIQFQMIVLAGSADETNMAQLGIAHYLEHLVLVGRNAGNEETAMKFFADGSSNGSTSQRMTSYVHRFPAASTDMPERLDKLFKFYSERLTDFAITPEEAVRERNVVRQEHDWRYASNPFSATQKEIVSYMFQGHPFEKWTIGSPETISAFTIDEARAFLRRWYRKSNVFFIVTGPMSEALVKEKAEKYLASLDATPPPERPWIEQKLNFNPESRTFKNSHAQIANPSVLVEKFIPYNSSDIIKTYAIRSILGMYLGSKLTGSPHSVFVEGDAPLAASMSGVSVNIPIAGVMSFAIGTIPEEGRTIDEQIPALKSYMSKLAERGLDASTIERLKKRYARDYQRGLDEPQNAPGRLIGWLTQPLPYEALMTFPSAVASVTSEEVNAMLKILAGEGREAIVIYEPKPKQ
jgi:zinc protease